MMKKISLTTRMVVITVILSTGSMNASAQFFKELKQQVKENVKGTVEQRSVEKANNGANAAIDKASSAVGAAIGKAIKKGKQSGNEQDGDPAGNPGMEMPDQEEQDAGTGISSAAMAADYKNYDFVPGDKIIFEPDMHSEPDAELPARYTVLKGAAEIQSYEGKKILHLQADANTAVEPLISTNQYLPEQFTLEFDMMYENDADYFKYVSDFRIGFSKSDDQNCYNGGVYAFVINGASQCSLGKSGTQNLPAAIQKTLGAGNSWHHIAIYVRKNIGKAYIDAYRVCAVNTLPEGAEKLYIKADRYGIKIKNLRLAAGGDDKYNKIVTDGKFITHGILFDVNKAAIKPESMGALNEIAKLMEDHGDLKFEIDGHTDSDGNDETNMELSQARADAVKAQLMEMGIDGNRFVTKGFGETKPIDSNETAEGKANNRRVEFVKM